MFWDSSEVGEHFDLGIEPVIPCLTFGRTTENVSGCWQDADKDLRFRDFTDTVGRPRQGVAAVINHGDVTKVPLIGELHFPTRRRQILTKPGVGLAESLVAES